MRPWLRIALLAAVPHLVGPAVAGVEESSGRFSDWVPPENPKCTCRYKGEHLPLGSRRCLQTPLGPRTAECVTEQNVTSWRPSSEPCLQSWLEEDRG